MEPESQAERVFEPQPASADFHTLECGVQTVTDCTDASMVARPVVMKKGKTMRLKFVL